MRESQFVDAIISKYATDEELQGLLITHSRCVAEKALRIADDAGLEVDRQFVYDAAMLHDIGIVECDAPGIRCFGSRPYICHGIAGADILRSEGLPESFARVCERHTGSGLTAKEIVERGLPLPQRDLLPETTEEKLICLADKYFSKSGDPSAEKPEERVVASIRRHGPEALERFLQLKKLFAPLPKNS